MDANGAVGAGLEMDSIISSDELVVAYWLNINKILLC